MTLQEWLKQGEAQLRNGPHPDRARRDAELLLMHLLRLQRAALLAYSERALSEEEGGQYLTLLSRRAAGEPIQYIVGETEFYGLPFRVTSDVLIPRPETEHLVEKAIQLAQQFDKPRIVDVGSGSGAIALALAHNLPQAEITAIDISPRALDIAQENASRNGVADRVRFLCGDLLVPVESERFDIVASNPPYVSVADHASLAVEVRDYEPAVALFAGSDGLGIYRRLIPEAHAALVPGGHLLLEIGYGQSSAVGDMLASAGFDSVEFVPDLQGIPRVAVAQRP